MFNRFTSFFSNGQWSFFDLESEAVSFLVLHGQKDSNQNRKMDNNLRKIKSFATRWAYFHHPKQTKYRGVRKSQSYSNWKNLLRTLRSLTKKSLHFPWVHLTCQPVLTKKNHHHLCGRAAFSTSAPPAFPAKGTLRHPLQLWHSWHMHQSLELLANKLLQHPSSASFSWQIWQKAHLESGEKVEIIFGQVHTSKKTGLLTLYNT